MPLDKESYIEQHTQICAKRRKKNAKLSNALKDQNFKLS
jgi:hypothetical protein